jgi:hypothetical protein
MPEKSKFVPKVRNCRLFLRDRRGLEVIYCGDCIGYTLMYSQEPKTWTDICAKSYIHVVKTIQNLCLIGQVSGHVWKVYFNRCANATCSECWRGTMNAVHFESIWNRIRNPMRKATYLKEGDDDSHKTQQSREICNRWTHEWVANGPIQERVLLSGTIHR